MAHDEMGCKDRLACSAIWRHTSSLCSVWQEMAKKVERQRNLDKELSAEQAQVAACKAGKWPQHDCLFGHCQAEMPRVPRLRIPHHEPRHAELQALQMSLSLEEAVKRLAELQPKVRASRCCMHKSQPALR
jgi:hypothetical protein